MFMFLFSFITAAVAGPATCSLTEILKADKPDRQCIEAYLNKIPNADDRSEAKFRLAQWKPIKDLEVESGEGMIEAFVGKKFLMRSVLMQRQKPMLIWMDGKILTDNSDNPSFARRLDNAFKKNKSAFFAWLVPQAFAQTSRVALTDTQQTLTMLYALDEPNVWSDARAVTSTSTELENFISPRTRIGRLVFGAREIRCASVNLVEPTEFQQSGSYSDVDTRLKITPKSPNEFLVTGLENGKTHLIKLSTWEARIPHSERTQTALALKTAANEATISTCADPKCASVTSTDAFDQWNYVLRKDPEAAKRFRAKSSKYTNQAMDESNAQFRSELVGKLFGLSVLGNCCMSSGCREKMTERFGISLKTPPTESSATQ